MQTTRWTPGPWQTARLDLDRCRVDIETVERGDDLPDQGYTIAVCYSGAKDEGANARRIVACVNACEGINPEAVPEMVEVLESVNGLLATNLPNFDGRYVPFDGPTGGGNIAEVVSAVLARARHCVM